MVVDSMWSFFRLWSVYLFCTGVEIWPQSVVAKSIFTCCGFSSFSLECWYLKGSKKVSCTPPAQFSVFNLRWIAEDASLASLSPWYLEGGFQNSWDNTTHPFAVLLNGNLAQRPFCSTVAFVAGTSFLSASLLSRASKSLRVSYCISRVSGIFTNIDHRAAMSIAKSVFLKLLHSSFMHLILLIESIHPTSWPLPGWGEADPECLTVILPNCQNMWKLPAPRSALEKWASTVSCIFVHECHDSWSLD